MNYEDENWSKQDDEIQALGSIFNEQFILDESNGKRFKIIIKEGDNESALSVVFHVELSPGYPSESPPTYNIEASWLHNNEKARLGSMLDEIYCNNLGALIVYEWVEKIKEFLIERTSLESLESKIENVALAEETISSLSSSEEVAKEDSEANSIENYEYDPNEFSHYAVHEPESVDKAKDGDEYELPPIHHGELIRDRKSTFQGHLAPVFHKKQVDMVMSKLKENKKIAAATHNIIAYRIDGHNGGYITGCYDDGEIHAGSRMLHLLTIMDAKNVLVVVTRWYGGIHLGTDRFKHINNCTRDLLEQHGYIQEKTKKGPKTNTGASPHDNKPTHKTKKHR